MQTREQKAERRQLLRKMAVIALPIALQNVLVTCLNMLDTLMISTIGENEVAAVGLANQPFFVFSLLLFGIGSGACVLTSQYYGAGNLHAVKSVMAFAVSLAAVCGIGMGALLFFLPETVMRFYTGTPELIALGAGYLKIAALSYPMMAISTTYLSIIVSVGEPSLPLKINVAALFCNTLLNLVLIFGMLGVPALGIRGAAVATVISRLLELSAVCVFAFRLDRQLKMRPRDFVRFDRALTRDFFRYCTPVILNEFLWGFGTSLYSVIIGHMAASVVAAYNVVMIAANMAASFQNGIGRAAGVIVGMELGKKDEKNAFDYAGLMLRYAAVVGVPVIALYMIIRVATGAFMALSAEAFTAMTIMLVVEMIVAVPRSIYCVAIIGVFRGGGDTVFCALADTLPIFLWTVPAGAAAAYFGLPLFAVYFLIRSDEIVKCVISIARYRGKKWMRTVTREDA